MSNVDGILAGIDLLLQLADRFSAVSAVIKQARAEGRDVSSDELAQGRAELDAATSALDEAIAKAKAEGR